MIITQATANNLTLKDTNYTGVVMGIIIAIVGIGLFVFAISGPSSNLLFTSIIASTFLVGGIIAILFTNISSVITFDKNANNLVFLNKRITGVKTLEYPLNSIMRIDLREGYAMTQRNNNVGFGMVQSNLRYQLILILNNGQEIPLDHLKGGGQSFGVNGIPLTTGTSDERMIGKTLAQFLNVPFSDPGIANMGQVLTGVISAAQQAAQNYSKPSQF